MWTISALILFFVCSFACGKSESGEEQHVGRGFGDDIDWVKWEDAVTVAKEQDKPILLIIHKTWCGACKALKNEFKNSKKRAELVKLSKNFVMVNTEDDEEPEDEKYAPDGGYIPRLFFLDTNGDLIDGTENLKYPSNKYYFPKVDGIINTMKKVLKALKSSTKDEKRNDPVIDTKMDDGSSENTNESGTRYADSIEKKETKTDKKVKKIEEKKKHDKRNDSVDDNSEAEEKYEKKHDDEHKMKKPKVATNAKKKKSEL